MASHAHLFILLLCIIILCIPSEGVYAFGAGNIPSFAFLEGKAFRHGDIEDTLGDVAKKAGGFALGALIGKGGSKFGGLDIKRVYFGNWLRDYSQAVDVAGLQKLQLQTIINLCMVLGFLAHGYATNEFEVTEDRLGVYLPTEHIDNPKGYPDNARQYHPKLRPPVDPRELEIDYRTGMKNYIANENGTWDTSKALVRRTLERCIQLGRQARSNGAKQDLYEAYRLLGQALHTLEDFPAHSNFCELALAAMGHNDIFLHVGDQVRVQGRNGKWVAPLVTGTFGSSDFIHSLLGEATDHISQASVSDLNAELDKARAKSVSQSSGPSPADTLRSLLFKLPGSDGQEAAREMESVERIRAAGTQPGGKRPEDMSPQELHAVLWQVLSFRDSVVKKIEMTIEKIPGLGPLIEKLMDSISVFIFTTLEPFLKPIMKQATNGLMAASGEVIDTHDQYEVFNDPKASDPTHSFLSKDHFNLILNEPAGNLGKIILSYTATLVVKAWDDNSVNVHGVTEDILQCLFHPDFHDSNSHIQREMLEYMRRWVQEQGSRQHEILRRLTKQAVRNHENIRLSASGGSSAPSGYAHDAGVNAQHQLGGYINQVPGVSQAQSLLGKISGGGAGGPPSNTPFGQATSFLNQFTGGQGGRREGGYDSGTHGAGYSMPGAGTGAGAHGVASAPPSTGEASSYYNPSGHSQPNVHPPSPPPVSHSSYPGAATYPNEPSFPSASGPPPPHGHGHGHGHGSGPAPPEPHTGYAPSYASSPPFGFPQADAGYPGAGQSSYPGQGGGGYPPYGGPPPPGPGGPPPGPPAGFGFPSPDAPPPGPPGPYGGPPPPPGGGYPGSRPFGW
ncbi:heterokaryon incompatibility protein Het-C-domain-containing protein [Trametes meyenii]|nr:heterokaryon incompatibility protein Het-C-domain-containing protein [Trametes meyenii]